MDFDEINRILDMVREHELSEFELEREGFKIKIKKGMPVNSSGNHLLWHNAMRNSSKLSTCTPENGAQLRLSTSRLSEASSVRPNPRS